MKYLGTAGWDMNGNAFIYNLADGTAAGDAVNKSQLDEKPFIRAYGGATYDVDPTADIYLRDIGDPAPSTVEGDVVITKT